MDAIIRQLRTDTALLGRALKALPAENAKDGSPAVFAAIARGYRNALAAAKRVRAVDTPHESKALAMTALTLRASGLEAWDGSLRPGSDAARDRQGDRASKYLRAAAKAFLELDRTLGCPYGCKGQR